MKSNMSVVLVAMGFFSLIISGTSENDEPTCVSNLRHRLHLSWFGQFLTQEQFRNQEFREKLYTKFVEAAKRAKTLIEAKNVDEGRTFLIKSIRDETIDNRHMNVEETIEKSFNGNMEVAAKLIKCFVEMFISEIVNDNNNVIH